MNEKNAYFFFKYLESELSPFDSSSAGVLASQSLTMACVSSLHFVPT
jgi:hypothetical protein